MAENYDGESGAPDIQRISRVALGFICICCLIALLILADLNREIRRARAEVNRARAGLGSNPHAEPTGRFARGDISTVGNVDSNGARADAAGMEAAHVDIVRPGDENARPPRRGGITGPGGINWAG